RAVRARQRCAHVVVRAGRAVRGHVGTDPPRSWRIAALRLGLRRRDGAGHAGPSGVGDPDRVDRPDDRHLGSLAVAPVGRMPTPLSRVRYLGSAHGGTHDFWMIRVTGAAAFPLSIAFFVVLLAAIGRPYAGVIGLIGSPLIAAVFALLLGVSAIHMKIGMQEIIED